MDVTGYVGQDEAGPFFHCDTCGSQSYNINDVHYRYCGRCHDRVLDDSLPMWVIYDHPSDCEAPYVARLWLTLLPTQAYIFADTLNELRDRLPEGLFPIARQPQDDPCIVESWV